MSASELPEDVWRLIWARLSFDSLFTSAQMVSKLWHEGVWQHQPKVHSDGVAWVSGRKGKARIDRFGAIRHLRATTSLALTNIAFPHKHLRYIHFPDNRLDAAYSEAYSSIVTLERLLLRNCGCDNSTLGYISQLTRLRVLDISENSGVTSLQSLERSDPSALRFAPGLTDPSLSLVNLKELYYACSNGIPPHEADTHLRKLTKLETIFMNARDPVAIPNSLSDHLPHLQNLVSQSIVVQRFLDLRATQSAFTTGISKGYARVAYAEPNLVPGKAVLYSSLHRMAKLNDVASVKALLAANASPKMKALSSRSTPLLVAIVAKAMRTTELFLNREDVLDFINEPDIEGVQTLLAHGASVNSSYPDGSTVLHEIYRGEFVASHSINIVQALVNAGAKIEARTAEGETPLHTAALSQSNVDVLFFLTLGANVHARMKRGGVQLVHLLIAQRNETLLPMIAPVGTNYNSPCYMPDRPTPLILATESNSPGLVRTLLQCGATPTGTDARGFTALHYLCWHWDLGTSENSRAILELLLKADSSLLEQRDLKGRTPLLIACKRSCGEAAITLIQRKANLKAVDLKSRNALYWALTPPKKPRSTNPLITDTLTMCNVLLAAGVPPAVHDTDGVSPLELALRSHPSPHLLNVLRSHGGPKTKNIALYFTSK